MNSISRAFLLAGCSAATLLFPTVAQAQSASEGDDIVVTANKREENLNKVGLTITAVTAEALAERKITSLEDVAGIVPGLTYTPSTTNTPIFTLRGVGFNESSLGVYPAVTVYIDQAPLVFPILAAHSAYDLERVEVLKGPQGTLFGQNSTGGAINYIAAKPTKDFQAGGDISYGRFNEISGNAFISGPLSETLGARLALTGLNSDDWQKSYTRRDGNGHQSYVAGRFLLDWQASDGIKFSLNVNAWRDKSQPQAQQLIAVHEQVRQGGGPARADAPPVNDPVRNYVTPPRVSGDCAVTPAACSGQLSYPFSPFNPRSADWSTMHLDPETGTQLPGGGIEIGSAGMTNFDPYGNRRFYQIALRADVDITDSITMTSLTSYDRYKQNQATDGDGMDIVAYDLQSGAGSIKSFNQELRFANDATSAFRWIVGGNFEKSKTGEDQMLRYFGNSNYYPNNLYINSSGDILTQNIRNYAFFGNLEYQVAEAITLKGAVRYTNSRNRASNCGYTQTNGNVDKLFNVLGGISGLDFDPIGPSDCYTLNSSIDTDILKSKHVTLLTPTASGIAGLGVPGLPMVAVQKENNVSWRFGIDYKASPDVLIYANVSRGYKAGSFPALAAAAFISALPVKQESVTAYEAGFKASMLDRKVQINAAGFYYDYKDKQVRGKLFDFIFGTLDTLVNIPKSRIYGAEADITVRPLEGLTVNAAVTYLNSKIKKFVGYDIFGGVDNANFDPTGNNTEDLSGNPLPYTPKWSSVFNVDYRYNPGGATPFFGLTVSSKSGQDAAIGGGVTTLPDGPRYRIAPGVGPYPYTIKGYTTVDGRLGYEGEDGKWRVMLWGKNIFNKYYWTAVIPSSDSSARFAGRPATYGITVGFKMK